MSMEDEKELRETVRALLESPSEQIPALLDEAGWDDLVSEMPESAITILFVEHARLLNNADILDDVILRQLGRPAGVGAVGYRFRGTDEVLLTRRPEAGTVVVAAAENGEGAVTIPADSIVLAELQGFDSSTGWFRGNIGAASAADLDWETAEAAGRRAVAAWMLGFSEEMLHLASEYTSQRVQYGRPIASFQSVRHRLSDCRVSIDGAEALLSVAFESGDPFAAGVAKAAANRAVRLVSMHATQVFGAVGSTKEHVLPRYVARGAIVDELLTDSRTLVDEIAATVLSADFVPRLAEI